MLISVVKLVNWLIVNYKTTQLVSFFLFLLLHSNKLIEFFFIPIILSKFTENWYIWYPISILYLVGGGGRDHMVVGFTTTYAISAITTKVVSLNPAHVEVYSIQHYVIKFVSDLRQVAGFLQVLRFPPPIKLTPTI